MGSKFPTVTDHPEAPLAPLPPLVEPRRRSWVWLVWLLILGGLGYGGYRFYQNQQLVKQAAATAQTARSAPRATPVSTTPVRTGDIPVYLRGLGSVAPFNSVTVKSLVDGQLIAIHFTEGQMVTKGQLLAEIDPRPFQVQLDQANGQLARDTAQLNDAKANLGRFEALFREQVLARQQLDTQRAAVGQAEGTLAADQAAINSAKLQLTYAKITAPISGRIGLRLVDVGNIVRSGDPNGLLVIAQLQPISVLFTIPADSLPRVLAKLRTGNPLRVDAYDRDAQNKIATGTLLTVDNQIDATTGTSRLKAVFPNADGVLFPNQFVNCSLLLDTVRGAPIVPRSAIQRGQQGEYVYVALPNKTAAVRPVTLGITEGENAVIQEGVEPGDLIITEGLDKLQDGGKIEMRGAAGGRSGRGGGKAGGKKGGQ